MATITARILDSKQWVQLPFWKRKPVGYDELHSDHPFAWTLRIKDGLFFLHGRCGRPILAFWYGTSSTGHSAWMDGSKFHWSPLRGTGLIRSYYPMVDWLGSQERVDG